MKAHWNRQDIDLTKKRYSTIATEKMKEKG